MEVVKFWDLVVEWMGEEVFDLRGFRLIWFMFLIIGK
jgi:hypothetical protein